MLKWLKNLIPEQLQASSSSSKVVRTLNATTANTIVYPPVDEGIPFTPVNELLDSQIDVLRSIRLSSGLEEKVFIQLVVPVIRNLANYIHLLPATRNGNHRGAGGLLRLSLEVGFYSQQAADGVILSGMETSENRRLMEPRWKFASLMAGLCGELHHSVNSIIVLNAKGDEWPVYQMPLTEWLIKTGSDRYFIKWKSVDIDQDRLAANTTFLINRIIHPEAVQYMRDGSNKIVSGVMGVITRSIPNSENSTLKNIVYEIRKRVVERDAAIQPDHYGRMTVGSHLDPYILDAMRQLVDDKTWKINQPKSRIWFAKDGLYIVWSSAAEELFATMNANKTPGMPKRKDTLLDLMASAGIIDSENESHLFLISPPDTTISMLAIRIINPYSILKAQADSITPCSSVLVTGDSSSSPVISEKINEEEKQNIVDQETGEILTESNQAVECVPIANEENAANIPVQLTDSETVSQPLEVPVKQEEKVAQDEVKADADVVDIGDEARKTIAALPPHLSEVISALVQDINRLDDGNNSAFRTKEGFAISTDMLASYGFSSTDLIKELKELGWLWYPPGNKNAKVHVLERAGSKVTAIVLSMAIAKHIGCPIQQQRNNN